MNCEYCGAIYVPEFWDEDEVEEVWICDSCLRDFEKQEADE